MPSNLFFSGICRTPCGDCIWMANSTGRCIILCNFLQRVQRVFVWILQRLFSTTPKRQRIHCPVYTKTQILRVFRPEHTEDDICGTKIKKKKMVLRGNQVLVDENNNNNNNNMHISTAEGLSFLLWHFKNNWAATCKMWGICKQWSLSRHTFSAVLARTFAVCTLDILV